MFDDEAAPQQQSALQIMQSVNINPMAEFCPDAKVGTSIAISWNNWQSDFDMYLTAIGITDTKRQRALLLYQAGPRVREIVRQIPDTGPDTDCKTAKQKLKAYFDPQKNRRYEVYRFRQATQTDSGTLGQFHTRLQTMLATASLETLNLKLKSRLLSAATE